MADKQNLLLKGQLSAPVATPGHLPPLRPRQPRAGMNTSRVPLAGSASKVKGRRLGG